MFGETVTVRVRKQIGKDELNDPIWDWQEFDVSNVLVSPNMPSDSLESTRPNGVTTEYFLYFPKTFNGDLAHAQIRVRGEWLNVIGVPRPFNRNICPTKWCMTVEVTRQDG